ncbi:hypothetical protein SAMN07250955_1068 [Arboricoccus pini]|uniref:Uncharacterized protein n=1 Tax=Arboricoccus pini TaxID=1963835 RepID=A0A212R6D8_9PROT|nr:hypothetical protein [Arboricoccus pini]SNB67632.1 hypothetical protein SAMN07250955_1068 [Arboricoccus pini]
MLAADPATALGSLYVPEDSRLNGRLIDRHLRATAAGLRKGRLAYLTRAGKAGRRGNFCADPDDLIDTAAKAAVLQGAGRTFDLLHAWLRPALGITP